jgi:hypothetical protein
MENLMNDLKNNNEKFSEEYVTLMREYYEKLSKGGMQNLNTQGTKSSPDQPDEEGGLVITPIPCCVIKTSDSNGQKIFINVTSHDKIEAPKEEHILEMENRLGVRLPMSLSEKIEDFDNKNQICQVYDVIFNTSIVKKTEDDPMAFQFMYEVVKERIRQRFNHELSQSFIKLKNLKYKGKVIRQQRVRVRLGPKIEEVIGDDKNGSGLFNQNQQQNLNAKEMSKIVNEKGKTPNWNLIVLKEKEISIENYGMIIENIDKFCEKKITLDNFLHNSKECENKSVKENFYIFYDGTNATPQHGQSLLYLIEMNLLSSSQGMKVNISDEGVVINCPKIYSLQINFPYRIDSKEAFSVFDSSKRFLFVSLPFYEKDCEEFREIFERNKTLQGRENNKENVNVNLSDDYLYELIE